MAPIEYNSDDRPNHSLSNWFWGGFIAFLLTGALIATFATIRGGKQWMATTLGNAHDLPKNWTEAIQVTLSGGETVFINATSVPHIEARTQAWLKHQSREMQNRWIATINRETQTIYQQASSKVPAFADWYYSLWGEYARLFYAAFANLPDYLSQQLQQQVFQPAGTTEAIDALTRRLDTRLTRQLHANAADFTKLLTTLVRSQSLVQNEITLDLRGQWALGNQLTDLLNHYASMSPEDFARQGAAISAGATVSAVALKKLGAMTVAKSSTKLMATKSLDALAPLAVKLGLKTAAKTGGSLGGASAGAVSGAALCTASIGGAPLAPGCALLGGAATGIATWLLVDKTVLEAQEFLNRDAFEHELHQTLAEMRDELRTTLEAHYTHLIQENFSRLRSSPRHSVRPIAPAKVPKKVFVPAWASQGN